MVFQLRDNKIFAIIVLSQNPRKWTKKRERICIDISSVNTNSFGKNTFWLLIQDEFTEYIWSEFITKKSQLPQVMLHWIYKTQKEANVKIKIIRLGNSGENSAFKKLIDRTEKLKIKFEFTTRGTRTEWENWDDIWNPLW
jgi:hypothetical protein